MLIVLSAITVMSITACKSDKDDKKELGGEDFEGTVYHGTGYSIKLPDNWVQATNESTDLIFTDVNSPYGDFQQTINIVIEDCTSVEAVQTAEDYMTASLYQFSNSDIFEIIDNDTIKCNDYDAAIVHLDADNGTYQYKCEQVYFVKDQIAYILTFSGELDGGYESTLEEAEQIFGTFTFTE